MTIDREQLGRKKKRSHTGLQGRLPDDPENPKTLDEYAAQEVMDQLNGRYERY